MHLRDLLLKLRASWNWDAKRYPKFNHSDSTSPRRHVLLHVMKAAGSLAGHHEGYDHGKPFGSDDYVDTSIKLLIDALQLVSLCNLSEDEILRRMDVILKQANE